MKKRDNQQTISVLITFYNQKSCIAQCLESVLSQKGEYALEILCGDDGSVDGTYEELKKWESNYDCIKVFRMPRDYQKRYEAIERVSANRVNLLRHAVGEFVAFLDGDDYYTNNFKLSIQLDLLNNNKKCVCCGHPIKEVWDDARKDDKIVSRVSDKRIIINNYIYWGCIWFHADTMLFRNIFLNEPDLINGIDSNFFDDNLITFYFLGFGPVIYTPECMVSYRQNINSSWNKRTKIQKAFINMRVYYSACAINDKFKFPSFLKTYEDWKEIYAFRKKEICEEEGMGNIFSQGFVKATINYSKRSMRYRIGYEIRFGLIPLAKPFVHVLRKLKKITYRKI